MEEERQGGGEVRPGKSQTQLCVWHSRVIEWIWPEWQVSTCDQSPMRSIKHQSQLLQGLAGEPRRAFWAQHRSTHLAPESTWISETQAPTGSSAALGTVGGTGPLAVGLTGEWTRAPGVQGPLSRWPISGCAPAAAESRVSSRWGPLSLSWKVDTRQTESASVLALKFKNWKQLFRWALGISVDHNLMFWEVSGQRTDQQWGDVVMRHSFAMSVIQKMVKNKLALNQVVYCFEKQGNNLLNIILKLKTIEASGQMILVYTLMMYILYNVMW